VLTGVPKACNFYKSTGVTPISYGTAAAGWEKILATISKKLLLKIVIER
jgi:hypothetical protein